ncbi:hypothetical protein BLNAU_13033 [Blattamonas nauphoetae]|uniref:Uncharacterized protein n=1 Tax=Blattamonas nauphoetae TaxID=2049346 RepID=A0ABQ9XJ39_9EUKA|nr:hypothetical protein BLNAU_13033 [Blattamonas nauphoetae]
MQIDEFIPQENLVVNKTKLTQITDWIDERISLSLGGRSSNYHCLLLLTGPAGCGKTASIRAICQKKGLHLVEWSDPTFSSFQSIQTTEQRSTDHSTTLFREFLFEGRKYEPLTFESPESAKTIVTRQLESFSHRPKTSPTHILLVDGLPYFPNRTMSKAFSDIVFEFINSFSVQAGVESILGLIITLTTTNNLTEQDFVKKQLLLSPEYVKHIKSAIISLIVPVSPL